VTTRLVIFGRQGAGKGTQSVRLAEHYGVPHISTGDMLREAVAEGSEFGAKAKVYLDSGELLPDDVMMGVIAERLSQPDAVDGFILDGIPRTVAQAEALLDITSVDVAVNLEVPESLVIERISSRRVCSNCGRIYSATDAAAVSGECDVCGGEVVQRSDDTPEAITARLDAYATKTLMAVAFLDRRGLVVTVDGVGSQDDITARIIEAIDVRLGRV
jgi:adenylate kinase